MRNALLSFAVLTLVLSGACRNDSSMPASHAGTGNMHMASADRTPEQLGVIGAQIRANPNEAARILSQNGLTEAQFEQAVRKVSENPDSSRQYAAAFRKAGGR